jgi:hypothetical protein
MACIPYSRASPVMMTLIVRGRSQSALPATRYLNHDRCPKGTYPHLPDISIGQSVEQIVKQFQRPSPDWLIAWVSVYPLPVEAIPASFERVELDGRLRADGLV